jgi:microcystin degradation protein MlrC
MIMCSSKIVSDRPLRILVGRLFHESHTFLDGRTDAGDFEIRLGSDTLRAEGDHSPLDAILTSGRRLGWDIVPCADIFGMPSATASDEVLEMFLETIGKAVTDSEAIDGVCLVLHGAMVTESCDDVEGRVIRELRERLGAEVPICGVLDLHGNIGLSMDGANLGFFAYRKNPHTDAYDAAERAALALDRCLSEGVSCATMVRQLPVLWAPISTGTGDDPMAGLEGLARELEQAHPELLTLNIFAGYAYADTPDTGACLTAVHEAGAEAIAADALDQLETLCMDALECGTVTFATEEEILQGLHDAESGEAPATLILVESADNIGGGAPGDGTGALRFVLKHQVRGALLAINDPAAVAVCRPGEKTTLTLGGKCSQMGEGPVEMDVFCHSLHDGEFELEDPRSHLASMQGTGVSMGPCAVLEQGGVTLLVTSRKTPPMDLGQFRSVGIEPSEYRLIAVKSAVAHRQAYASIPHRSFHLDTPGPCASRLDRFPYQKLRPRMFPFQNFNPQNNNDL